MSVMVKLKATKNQGFTLSQFHLEQKPQGMSY